MRRKEFVLPDTSIIAAESHPMHLHGFNFFVVGQGIKNFDPNNDPAKFNLVDPPERNTVGVPSGGWVVIRFLADNPGLICIFGGIRLAWNTLCLLAWWLIANFRLTEDEITFIRQSFSASCEVNGSSSGELDNSHASSLCDIVT